MLLVVNVSYELAIIMTRHINFLGLMSDFEHCLNGLQLISPLVDALYELGQIMSRLDLISLFVKFMSAESY